MITHDNGIAAQARRVVRIMDGKIESDFINKNYGKEEYIKKSAGCINPGYKETNIMKKKEK